MYNNRKHSRQDNTTVSKQEFGSAYYTVFMLITSSLAHMKLVVGYRERERENRGLADVVNNHEILTNQIHWLILAGSQYYYKLLYLLLAHSHSHASNVLAGITSKKMSCSTLCSNADVVYSYSLKEYCKASLHIWALLHSNSPKMKFLYHI